MFSLPRDMVDVPIPPGPARSVFGSVYAGKINSLWLNARNRSDAFPGNDKTRGFNALKAVLGELYGLDIQYYLMVNFQGFKDDRRHPRRGHDQRPEPGRRRPLPGRRRRQPAGLHPGRRPAHGRHPGAHLRPLAAHLERLRPSPAPAAGDPVDPRAGRPAQGPRQPEPAAQGPQDVVQDRHPAGQAARPDRPVEPDRHEPDPVVRLHPAALRQPGHRQPRLSDRAQRHPDPARPSPTRSRSTRSSRPSASRSPARTARSGSSTAPARSARRPRSRPTSSTSG